MTRPVVGACLVLALTLSGCSGAVDPVEERSPGGVQGKVVSDVPDDATAIALNSSAVAEDYHVAAAVRAAVAQQERVSGADGVSIGLNASAVATADALLDDMGTNYVRHEGYVVEVTLFVED